ncbi:MAG: Hsp70 family protein [Lachnospiraceae bacterium]
MIIGIDLGTTNSLAAYFDGEQCRIIPNRLGEKLTPSVVSVDAEGTVYIGATAKVRKLLDPTATAEVFKRSMGTEKEFVLRDKKFRAEELSSLILRSLKEDAEAYLKEAVTEAIISVPAYFNYLQRKATKKAGELAGLHVERIINEPTAAAIAHGIQNTDSATKFLVFDLGGGTFDVSILELFKNIMEVRAIAGDNYIGGEDFTDVLVELFLTEHGLIETELDFKTLELVRKQAENCKLQYSESRTVTMKCSIGDKEMESEITTEAYEEACRPLLDKISRPIERSLKDADIRISEINEVVLVGGATRLPLIRKFVGRLFRRLPYTELNPDEAIAIGAAVQCGMKMRNEAIKEIVLTDVCPFTLGTDIVIERYGMFKEAGHYMPIIERNTVIPVSRTQTLYTASDYQNKIRVKVLQGESRLTCNNIYLGEVVVPVPPNKEGEESVDVTYTYDNNAILEVEVKVNSTNARKKLIIQKEDSFLTQAEIEQRFEELKYLKIHPRDQEANKLLLLHAEQLYEESTGNQRQYIDELIAGFEHLLNKQDRLEIERGRKDLKEKLDELTS